MNVPNIAWVAAAALLCACTTLEPVDLRAARAPDKCKVKVSLDEDSEITVDHEPVRIKRCADSRKVVWSLQGAAQNGWSFHASEGITMKTATTNASCPPVSAGADTFSCTFTRPASLEKLGYRIKLVKSTSVKELDPTVFND